MVSSPFAHRVVLVTGASSGLGAEFARQFATQGAKLALAARRTDRLDALAAEIHARAAPLPRVFPADLADSRQCDALVDSVEAALGPIDVLVNNAGLGELGPMHECEPQAVQRMIAVNVAALTQLTRRVTPGMVQRRRGWVLNVASVGGFTPMPTMAVYGASKAYVVSFSEALHVELRPHGVRVCCICPGTTRSEFFDRGGFERHRGKILRMAADPEKVVRSAIRALARGRMTRIPGIGTAAQTWFLTRLMPRRWVAAVVGFALRTLRK